MSVVDGRSFSTFQKSIIAGSASGIASVIVCHPIDTIRTRLQVAPERFQGFFNCINKTVQQETIAGFYKGMLLPVISQAMYKSVIFTTSSKLRNEIFPSITYLKSRPKLSTLLAGGFAGGLNAFLVTPVELIRNRLQVQYERDVNSRLYKNPFHCFCTVVRQEGPLALYNGLAATILRDAFGVAFYFLGYDFAFQMLENLSLSNSFQIFAAGAFGGMSFWLIASPFDTIKSLTQVDRPRRSSKAGKPPTTLEVTRNLVRDHGAPKLFRGWQAAYSRGIPGAAITFWVYNRTSAYLNADVP